MSSKKVYQMTIDGKLIEASEASKRSNKRQRQYELPTRDSEMYYRAATELYRVARETMAREDVYKILARCTRYANWPEIALELARGLPDGMYRLRKLLAMI